MTRCWAAGLRRIARYLGVDAVLIRLLAVVLAIVGGGAGLIAYLVAWIVIPKDRPVDDPSATQSTAVPSGRATVTAWDW